MKFATKPKQHYPPHTARLVAAVPWEIKNSYWVSWNIFVLNRQLDMSWDCAIYTVNQKHTIFRFTVLTAVHLQNANAKFHKVGQRHYSGEAENVYISVRRIYSGQ